ncbi:MAG: hypothetical protein N2489_04290 [Clostridia bacterium]|nr:hypothetical protein [Clostridia bacterium]
MIDYMYDTPIINNEYKFIYKNRSFTHPRCYETCKVLEITPSIAQYINVLVEFPDGYRMVTDKIHLVKLPEQVKNRSPLVP